MRYAGITRNSLVNGEGIRTVLWVTGCSHKCAKCQNPDTWNPNKGFIFNGRMMYELFSYIDKPYCDGLTLSGGDPLYILNRDPVFNLCYHFRAKFGGSKTIWLYTGYVWEDIKDLEIMDYIDILVDGEYVDILRDENLKYRGSSNQRIIDVIKSRSENRIILWD